MSESTASEVAYVACSCCGKDVPDTAAGNVSHGVEPYPHDVGVGMCRECGGDDRVKPSKGRKVVTEKQARRRIGWAGCMFYDARIEILRKSLKAANLAKFEAMSYVQKCDVVAKLVQKGVIV